MPAREWVSRFRSTLGMWKERVVASDEERYAQKIVDDAMQELEEVGLLGRTWEPREYADMLEGHTGMYIPFGNFRELDNPLLETKLKELGLAGATLPDPDRNTIWVVLPEGISGLARREITLHELSHIACAHRFKARYRIDVMADSEEEWYREEFRPPHKFSISPTVDDDNAYEDEADTRAVALLHASIYGSKMTDRPEHFLGLTGGRTPRPMGPLEVVRFYRRR